MCADSQFHLIVPCDDAVVITTKHCSAKSILFGRLGGGQVIKDVYVPCDWWESVTRR